MGIREMILDALQSGERSDTVGRSDLFVSPLDPLRSVRGLSPLLEFRDRLEDALGVIGLVADLIIN